MASKTLPIPIELIITIRFFANSTVMEVSKNNPARSVNNQVWMDNWTSSQFKCGRPLRFYQWSNRNSA